MGLYESNYLRLARLAGELRQLQGTLRSRVAGDCDLTLTVLDRARYTSELLLTYILPAATPQSLLFEPVPDLRLCVYHDARLVALHTGEQADERQLARRWQRNHLLNRWLEYCIDRGHRFG